MSVLSRIFQRLGLGAVDGGKGTIQRRKRAESWVNYMIENDRTNLHQDNLHADTADNYGPGLKVSIEGAAGIQKALQEGLDQQVVDEKRFPEDPEQVTRRGLPPCKRVKQEGSEGRSGNKERKGW